MKKAFIVLAVFATPFIASAEAGNLSWLIDQFGAIVNKLVPLVSTLVIVFFFWGLAKYVLAAGDEDKKKEGKNIMIWGTLALFVMVSIWGIIAFLQTSLGVTGSAQTQNIQLPNIKASQSVSY